MAFGVWVANKRLYSVNIMPDISKPQMEFFLFKLYEISEDGVKKKIFGEKARKFTTHLEISKPHFFRNDEEIKSESAIYTNDLLYLSKNVHYRKKDLNFKANDAFYDMKKEIFKTKGKFTIFDSFSLAKGKDLIYYKKSGKILAKEVFARIKEDK
jgi:hypothetical protein